MKRGQHNRENVDRHWCYSGIWIHAWCLCHVKTTHASDDAAVVIGEHHLNW